MKNKFQQGAIPGFNNSPQQQQFQVDISKATRIECSNCGGKFFQPAVAVYKVSALVSPNGQELIAQQPVIVCLTCQTPIENPTK